MRKYMPVEALDTEIYRVTPARQIKSLTYGAARGKLIRDQSFILPRTISHTAKWESGGNLHLFTSRGGAFYRQQELWCFVSKSEKLCVYIDFI